ncbi:uncharacterized protein LOC112552459 [Pogonomyrmex barbatus]|uniref:Uncharacterized protein LOC112552459 n=1 Tax=Pogonomyrmex barbatus TaxID=144034 RepID=A0A8N1S675_9HYME|nr:uncharacterized protein LOC112552459 [Pogonomyrmex barbatus]
MLLHIFGTGNARPIPLEGTIRYPKEQRKEMIAKAPKSGVALSNIGAKKVKHFSTAAHARLSASTKPNCAMFREQRNRWFFMTNDNYGATSLFNVNLCFSIADLHLPLHARS